MKELLLKLIPILRPMGRPTLTSKARKGEVTGINIFDLTSSADVEKINAFCSANALPHRAKLFKGKGYSAKTGELNKDFIFVGPPVSADTDDQLADALVVE